MSETKSYEISINFSDRISLFISGALTWRQLKSKDAFYIQQNEIQFLTNARLKKDKFVCFFERDYKMHHLALTTTENSSLYKDNQSLIRSHFFTQLMGFKYQLTPLFATAATALLISTDRPMFPPAFLIYDSNRV